MKPVHQGRLVRIYDAYGWRLKREMCDDRFERVNAGNENWSIGQMDMYSMSFVKNAQSGYKYECNMRRYFFRVS